MRCAAAAIGSGARGGTLVSAASCGGSACLWPLVPFGPTSGRRTRIVYFGAVGRTRAAFCSHERRSRAVYQRRVKTRGLSPCGMFHTGVYSPGPARTDDGGTSGCCSSRSPDAPSS